MIFGGFQKGEDISTQVVVFNTSSYSFLGLKSRLNFTDCFQLSPVIKQEELVGEENKDDEEVSVFKGRKLYSWSIYGNLHVLDMFTFQWSVLAE